MTIRESKTLAEVARDAIACQDACNLSGVAHSMLDAIAAVRASGITNTTEVNRHAIVRVFLAKLADLAGMEYTFPAEDWDLVQRLAWDGGQDGQEGQS